VDVDAVVKHDDGGYMERRDRARTQMQIIQSRAIAEQVVERYASEGGTDLPGGAAGVDALRAALAVQPKEDTELVEISVTHVQPDVAALLANLVAEVYAASNLTMRTDAAREAQGWIGAQSEAHKATLDDASTKVLAFKQQYDVADIDQAVDGVTARLAALEAAASDATTQRLLLESRLSQHKALLARGAADVLTAAFDDPGLRALAQERARVITETAEVLARYGEQHPEHRSARERVARIDALITQEVERGIDGERAQVDTLRRQEAQIAEELAQVKAELLEKQRLRAEYSVLKQEEDNARAVFGTLGERRAEVDLQASTRLNDVRLVDRAVPPKRPVKPNVLLNMLAAALVGSAGGVAIALLRNRMSDTLLSTQDVGAFDAPLLGIVPSIDSDLTPEQRDTYAVDRPRSLAAESFRGVRAVLQAFPPRGPTRRYIVTSCLDGEGKSLVAIGLAAAFAQFGSRVLLVDADLRLPRLHNVFSLPQQPGLSDCLVDLGDPEQFISRSSLPRLHVLRCGTRVEYPNELLASDELERALAVLSEAYDVVILDTPPAALVVDALELGRRADGVILVARRGVVPRELVGRTIQQLRQLGSHVMGIVLNDVPRTNLGYGSRYYDERARKSAP
jgi:capsular exopolysaccharide synthesis family protein